MDTTKLIQQHKLVCKLISERKVRQSIDILQDMAAFASNGVYRDELANITLTYRNILKYTIEGVHDPERDKVYLKLLQSILTLSDRLKQDILSHYSGWHSYWVKQQSEREMKLTGGFIGGNIDKPGFLKELKEWNSLIEETHPNPESEPAIRHRKLVNAIFNHLWLTDYYAEPEEYLLGLIIKSGNFRWHESSLFMSAVMLSLFRTWQSSKVFCLIDAYTMGPPQVRERALAGLVLSLHYHNDRLFLYPEVAERLKTLSADGTLREHCRLVILQAVRSRETEKLSRKMNEEILPKMAKLRPNLEEKLDLDNILPGDLNEGRNPDWSKVLGASDDLQKTMEELSSLQMEGADIYMSAFANLKHFDYFRDFKNWFMPFYPENEAVDTIFTDEILGPGTNDLALALQKTPFICNSDKYSLLLNLKYLPASQKTMMLKVFRMELEGLEQMASEEPVSDPYKSFRVTITQYMQDLYRFFKISPYRKEFEDIFSGRMDIYNSSFFLTLCNSPEIEASLSDYFFSKNYYDDALDLFLRQVEKRPDDSQLYEKTGYCYQEAGFYEEALNFYKKAELIDRKVWTIKKIALCLRRLDKKEEALDFYLQAHELEPSDIHTVVMVAHCYLDLKEYENALKYYFRVLYLDPDNKKILRPVAWCCLALGRLKDSEKYYDQLSEEKVKAHDLINRGHLALCSGDKRLAIEYYRQSLSTGDIVKNDFLKILNEDKQVLFSNGVNPDDLPILLDYLFFIVL